MRTTVLLWTWQSVGVAPSKLHSFELMLPQVLFYFFVYFYFPPFVSVRYREYTEILRIGALNIYI